MSKHQPILPTIKSTHKTRKKSYKFILYLVLIVVLTWISGLGVFFNNKNNGKENVESMTTNNLIVQIDSQSTNSLENLKMSKNSTYQNCEFEFSCKKLMNFCDF